MSDKAKQKKRLRFVTRKVATPSQRDATPLKAADTATGESGNEENPNEFEVEDDPIGQPPPTPFSEAERELARLFGAREGRPQRSGNAERKYLAGLRIVEEEQPKTMLEARLVVAIIAAQDMLDDALLGAVTVLKPSFIATRDLGDATKLTRLLKDLWAALDRVRGKQPQKFIVEHVHHVDAGSGPQTREARNPTSDGIVDLTDQGDDKLRGIDPNSLGSSWRALGKKLGH